MKMYIIAIAWVFVVALMSAAEMMAGSIVGGLLTFFFYCVVPLGTLLYILGTPQRRRNRLAREAQEENRASEDAAPRDA